MLPKSCSVPHAVLRLTSLLSCRSGPSWDTLVRQHHVTYVRVSGVVQGDAEFLAGLRGTQSTAPMTVTPWQ